MISEVQLLDLSSDDVVHNRWYDTIHSHYLQHTFNRLLTTAWNLRLTRILTYTLTQPNTSTDYPLPYPLTHTINRLSLQSCRSMSTDVAQRIRALTASSSSTTSSAFTLAGSASNLPHLPISNDYSYPPLYHSLGGAINEINQSPGEGVTTTATDKDDTDGSEMGDRENGVKQSGAAAAMQAVGPVPGNVYRPIALSCPVLPY